MLTADTAATTTLSKEGGETDPLLRFIKKLTRRTPRNTQQCALVALPTIPTLFILWLHAQCGSFSFDSFMLNVSYIRTTIGVVQGKADG